MKRNSVWEEKTAKRVYWIDQGAHGLFYAHFQPLHPKTGVPWQASHSLTEGRDVWYAIVSHADGIKPAIITPVMTFAAQPVPADWHLLYRGYVTGYSSFELALSAIRAKMKAHGV